MSKRQAHGDLTGRRFSRLLVLSKSGDRIDGHISWLCRCDCGNEKAIRTDRLIKGITPSCGCDYKRGPVNSTPEEKIKRLSVVNEKTGCWEWIGAKSKRGYGTVGGKSPDGVRKVFIAPRYFYRHFVGPIPDGLLVLHRCDNPPCVNPGHLFLGTHSDNMQDMIRKGRAPWQKKGG